MVGALEALITDTMMTTSETASMAAVRVMTNDVALTELSKPTSL